MDNKKSPKNKILTLLLIIGVTTIIFLSFNQKLKKFIIQKAPDSLDRLISDYDQLNRPDQKSSKPKKELPKKKTEISPKKNQKPARTGLSG